MSGEAGSLITTYFRVCDGVRVRFADTGAGSDATNSDTTLLLLAPWPESVWAFRRIWHQLTPLGRTVAVELPGFGHSDQSRPELIAPDAAGEFLARLIDEWGLGSPHVVGPDVGTAAALFLAARTPERVTSLTVGGGAVRFPIDVGGALKDVIEAPSLDAVRALDARTNIGYAVEAGAASDTEPEVHEDYVSAYDLGRFAESARFVRHYPEQEPGPPRPAANNHHANPDHRRPTRRSRSLVEQRVPPRARAQQRDSRPRRRALRLGAGRGRIRPPGCGLGRRRLPTGRNCVDMRQPAVRE